MNIFGKHWEDHHGKIRRNWLQKVSDDDIVLLPGDISWAMKLREASEDLRWLGELPGRKIIIRGNHDYWWSSLRKVSESLPESILPLQNSAWSDGDVVIAGSRGWITPLQDDFSEERDGPVYRREQTRLMLSLDEAGRLMTPGGKMIVMMHYPPVVSGKGTEFSRILTEKGADLCVYGHLHNSPGDWNENMDMLLEGVEYRLVSSDYLGFDPVELHILNGSGR